MRDAGVDRDHEIEQRDDGGGVGEVLQVGTESVDVRQRSQNFLIAVAQIALQADKLNSFIAEQRGQLAQRDRAVVIVLVGRAAGPDEPDLSSFAGSRLRHFSTRAGA